MTDRELLEDAAKAAGIEFGWIHDTPRIRAEMGWTPWNPLTDDGDALRLAVKLKMNVHLDSNMVDVDPDGISWFSEAYGTDPLAATRRAIVRAAAAIGRSMK
jgi:hypothetical protein